MAGAGIRGGAVYGGSDKDAAIPVDHPISPERLEATIDHALDIDPGPRPDDPQARPVSIVERAEPVLTLLG